jgi:hypothetical protein
MGNNNKVSSKSFYNFNQNSKSYSYNHNFKNKLSNINKPSNINKLSNIINNNKNNNSKKKNKMKIRSSLPNHEISTNYLIKSPKNLLTTVNNNSYKENISNKLDKNNNKVFSLQFRNKNIIYNYKENKKFEN